MHERQTLPIFDRLPSHFRTRDAAQGRPLEALMGLFTGELQLLERDVDQLYDNWFVETCEPWVLPYLAALVGARPMREIGEDRAGLLRAYVANILQYRQAKGTAAAIEQVARDVTGWPVLAVEFFQLLAASQNVNHVRPDAVAFADVRDAAAARRAHGPFSAAAHAAAAGPADGWSGRYNIPNIGLFVWRQAAAPLAPLISEELGYLGGPIAAVHPQGPGLLRFDPLGRDLPLVNRPAADVTIAARMTERTVPAPLRRDVLHAVLGRLRDTGDDPAGWFRPSPVLRIRLDGAEVPPERMSCCNLDLADDGTWRRPHQAGDVMFDPRSGRISLHADDEGKPVETGFAHAAPFDIGGGPYLRRASVSGWLPDFAVPEDPPWQVGVSHRPQDVSEDPDQGGPVVATLQAAIDRWNAEATEGSRGIIAVFDNATYPQPLTGARRLRLPKASRLAIVSAAWPVAALPGGVLRRTPGELSPLHRRAHVRTNLTVEAAAAGEGARARLVIDGICLEGSLSLSAGGDLGGLDLFNCTVGLRNGELRGGLLAPGGNDRLGVVIDRCIVARAAMPTATGGVTIRRSILGEDRIAGDGSGATGRVLDAPAMDAVIGGSTLFGRCRVRSIEAENSIFTARVAARRKQHGCVRFCYLPLNAAVPRRYRCVPAASSAERPRPVFTTTRYAVPGFGQLNMCTPAAILEGAEDGMEMGVGFASRDPARRANLLEAVEEFSPFGLTPGLHFMS